MLASFVWDCEHHSKVELYIHREEAWLILSGSLRVEDALQQKYLKKIYPLWGQRSGWGTSLEMRNIVELSKTKACLQIRYRVAGFHQEDICFWEGQAHTMPWPPLGMDKDYPLSGKLLFMEREPGRQKAVSLCAFAGHWANHSTLQR